MKIAEFLREDLILPDLQATDKTGVLRELCASLGRAHGLDAGRLTEVLLEREKLGSTGVGEGVAIPHGKLPGVPNLLAAFGPSKRAAGGAAALTRASRSRGARTRSRTPRPSAGRSGPRRRRGRRDPC